jgi:hypothetical protein
MNRVLLAQATTIPTPPFGGWLNGFVDQVTGDVNPWLANAQLIMHGLFAAFLILVVVFALARRAVQDQSIAGWGHALPLILMDLLPPFLIVYAAPAFVLNTLSVGLGLGSSITGYDMTGPSAMAGAFEKCMRSMLGAPFSQLVGTMTQPPSFSWQYLSDLTTVPALAQAGLTEEIAAFFLCVLFVLPTACLCTLTLVFVEVDALVVTPFALVLVAFCLGGVGGSLWEGALHAWVRRVFRLAVALGIAVIAMIAIGHVNDSIAALNPLDYKTTLYGWLVDVLEIVVVGGLTAAIPFALDAGISGAFAFGAGVPRVNISRDVYGATARVLMRRFAR